MHSFPDFQFNKERNVGINQFSSKLKPLFERNLYYQNISCYLIYLAIPSNLLCTSSNRIILIHSAEFPMITLEVHGKLVSFSRLSLCIYIHVFSTFFPVINRNAPSKILTTDTKKQRRRRRAGKQ